MEIDFLAQIIKETIEPRFGWRYLNAVRGRHGITDRRLRARSAAEFLHSATMEFGIVEYAEAAAWAEKARWGDISMDWVTRLAESEFLPFIIDGAVMTARITARYLGPDDEGARERVLENVKALEELCLKIERPEPERDRMAGALRERRC